MTDLLESLVLPNSSQESFHSLAEHSPHPSPCPPANGSVNHDPASPQSSAQSQFSALQAAGLEMHDVDTYLADPENAELLHRAPDRKNAPPKQPKPEIDAAQPVSLGSKSSHNMTALNLLCQQKGLLLDFQIEGDASNADFGGLLKVGDVTIPGDKRWHSKKEAREALAEKGLEVAQGMEAKKKQLGTPGEKDKNWIGILAGKCSVSTGARATQYSCPTVNTRIPPICRSKARASVPRLFSRVLIQLYMYHSQSSRPSLRFLSYTISCQEGSTCKCCETCC